MLDSFTIIYSVCAGYFLQRVSGVHRVRASPVLATGAAPSAPRPGTRSDPARTQPGYRSEEPNKKQKLNRHADSVKALPDFFARRLKGTV